MELKTITVFLDSRKSNNMKPTLFYQILHKGTECEVYLSFMDALIHRKDYGRDPKDCEIKRKYLMK